MSQRNELTICSVSYRNAQHLELNWETVNKLNVDPERIHWIIAENTSEKSPRQNKLLTDRRFTVIPGVSPQPMATYQHTMALNKCLAEVRTRYVLVLDPDFYIIRPDWIDLLIGWMQAESLSFVGTTWNPKYSEKYRYFPTLHCFLADTSRIGLEELDFRPLSIEARMELFSGGTNKNDLGTVSSKWSRFMSRFPVMQDRTGIHSDTGGRLFYKYAASADHSYRCFTPVFREVSGGSHDLSWKQRLVESLLPDELCRVPKNKRSYRTTGFAEQGLWTAVPSQWDEFYWKDEPFGFHIRRNAQKDLRNESAEMDLLKSRLQAILPSS